MHIKNKDPTEDITRKATSSALVFANRSEIISVQSVVLRGVCLSHITADAHLAAPGDPRKKTARSRTAFANTTIRKGNVNKALVVPFLTLK